MGSIPESVDCFSREQPFDRYFVDQQSYPASSMDPGGVQSMATSSHLHSNVMSINVDPAHVNGNYGSFDPQEFQKLHFALMADPSQWHHPSTVDIATAATWPMQPSDLHLQTDHPPARTDAQAPSELVSPADIIRRTSISTENTVDPSQEGQSGSASPRKRSKAKVTGVTSPRKHKRTKTNSEEIVEKFSESDGDIDLADVPEGEGGDHKREKFLARNRIAASKCRQKKKEWTNQLEDKARELSTQQTYLTATVNMLRNELLELKCRCLEHHDCDCTRIRNYLKSTVAGLKPAMDVYNDTSSVSSHTRCSSTSMVSGSMSDQCRGSPRDRSEIFGSFSSDPAGPESLQHQSSSISTAPTVDTPDQPFAYGMDARLSPKGLHDEP